MPDTAPAAKAAAIRHLWRTETSAGERRPYLYALLDGARDPAIHPALRRLAADEEVASLYQGAAARDLAAVAPYLVCLGTTDRVFDWLWTEGWGHSWGIFLWSVASFDSLRAHCRTLTKIRTEAGATLLFRFYDPRVLTVFLPTCTTAQLGAVFGPVTAFMLETGAGTGLELATHHDGVLRRSVVDL